MTQAVMIIEDDADLRTALCDALSESGYAVVPSPDGSHALTALHRMPTPGLILLDLNLPVVDGWVFRSIQRRLEGFSSTPVVVMSALPLVKEYARDLNAVAWLSKPIQMGDLLKVVEAHVSAAAQADFATSRRTST